MTATRSPCCNRVIVSAALLAEVSHSGCTLPPLRHPFAACPHRLPAIFDAQRRLDRLDAMVAR
jgi:hypothetical protein